MLSISMDNKVLYEAPSINVLELKAGGIICQSGNLNVIYEEEVL